MIIFLTIAVIFILFFWVIRIIHNILSFTSLWFIKEYRFDRMWIYIKTEGIRSLLFPRFRRPPFRIKTIFLSFFTILFLGCIYFVLPFSSLMRMIIMDALTFPLMAVLVLFFHVPTIMYHEILIFLAAKKLRSHTPMIIVGITGSVGKTTTKEYLATILEKKFHVLKTTGSQNAAIGIAETILKRLKPEHEVFVVEMAAYKKGEIAKIARLVCPAIGIVTSVNEQHLDLFGTLEDTMKAKYELIDALVEKSIAILNADNVYTRHMATQAHEEGKNIWMYTKEQMKFNAAQKMFMATHVVSDFDSISFTLSVGNQTAKVRVALSGEHQVSTVLASIAGAVACGMDISDVVSATKDIRPYRKTMQLMRGVHGSIFIDDTFNNNPDAAKAAIQFLKKANGRKFLVFQPMIELGNVAEKAHKEVGALAGRVCDEIILTNTVFSQFFIEGVGSAGFKKDVHVFSSQDAANYLSSALKKDDMVLFKGKEAAKVLTILT